MELIIPTENFDKGEKVPILWLLPPLGKNQCTWLHSGMVEEIIKKYKIMAAMPDIRLSFGIDMVHGEAYNKLLTEELPKKLGDMFPGKISGNLIFGVEEGAYGALYTALNHPENYIAAASASCGSLTDEILEGRKLVLARRAFGRDPESLNNTEYDIKSRLKEGAREKIFLYYGRKDAFATSASILGGYLPEDNVEVIKNSMGWKEWNEALASFLLKVMCY
jgi:S-formylglutathione hydrolase FrmB